MSKAYLFTTLMICISFTGCIENDDEEDSSTLRDSVYNVFDWRNTQSLKEHCRIISFTEKNNEIILANNTEINECVAEGETGSLEYKNTIGNYTEENLDYRAASNSGFFYSVNITIEMCQRTDEFEPWDCNLDLGELEIDMLWVEVGGQWVWWDNLWSFLEQGESAPIATFTVEESSGGEYYVKVIKVSKQEDLDAFSFFLKDETGSTYVGGNGFGEAALQMIDGNEHGIERTYNGDDEVLERRSENVSADDGTDFPVHFSDNDRDGKLSAGDEFTVFGTGNSANGPAQSGWRLDIQFDASGDIVGWGEMN